MKLLQVATALVFALSLTTRSAEAQFGLFKSALQKGYDAYDKEDYEKALQLWTKSAEKGNAEAQYRLGRLYDRGEGTEENPVLALEWYTKAAEQGVEEAQTNLGALYDLGRGTEENDIAAAKWFAAAAKQGNMVAQYNLAVMLDNGEGIATNKAQAAVLYRKAAAQGMDIALLPHAKVLDQLGKPMAAINRYQAAAKAGSPEALYILGLRLLEGKAVEADVELGMKRIKASAKKDFPPALLHMGVATLTGQYGITVDAEAGLALMTAAAEKGSRAGDHGFGSCLRFRSGCRARLCAITGLLRNCCEARQSRGDECHRRAPAYGGRH